MQSARHVRLGMLRKLGIRREELREPRRLIPLLNPVWIHNTAIPLEAGLEPPGFLSMFPYRIRVRQAPIAKLRNQQRQICATFLLVIGIPDRGATFSKFSHPFVPFSGMVRQDIVMMEIFQVPGYMCIAITG